jgi:hypothetical protein
MDGIGTGGAPGVSLLIVIHRQRAEITISTTGGSADAKSAARSSTSCRARRNLFSGQFFGSARPRLKRQLHGLVESRGPAGRQLEKVWDVNLAVGGPIKKDKLWFFATTRNQAAT